MLFLIFDNHIVMHGKTTEELRPRFRETMERVLNSSCTIYIDGQPIKHTLPRKMEEKLDTLDQYLLNGTKEYEFKIFGRYGKVVCRYILRVESYEM